MSLNEILNKLKVFINEIEIILKKNEELRQELERAQDVINKIKAAFIEALEKDQLDRVIEILLNEFLNFEVLKQLKEKGRAKIVLKGESCVGYPFEIYEIEVFNHKFYFAIEYDYPITAGTVKTQRDVLAKFCLDEETKRNLSRILPP